MANLISHQILGGKVYVYRREGSPVWQCSTYMKGRNWRVSTREDGLDQAKQVAEDWYLRLRGEDKAGILKSEKTFNQAADKFIEEYMTLTEGQRSPKWAESHEARLRLHLRPFFGKMGLSEIDEGAVQDYRVHRMKTGTVKRFGNAAKAPKDKALNGAKDVKPTRRKKPKPTATSIAKDDEPTPPARSTLHDEIVTLRMVLKTALRRKWLKQLPDLAAPYKTQGKVVHRPWFSPEEYKHLYTVSREYARNPPQPQYKWHAEQLHDYILFIGNCGLRPDEAMPKNLLHRDVTIATDPATGQRILEIEVRGKRGVGYCKSMPGAVRPYERLLNRPKPTRGQQKRNRSKLNPNPPPPVELPEPSDPLFPGSRLKLFNKILAKANLKHDREGKPRTTYSLRHTYICLRLMEGADIYQVAKNCRTSVEMIEKHYAAHIKNTLDAASINVMRSKAARTAERQAKNDTQRPKKETKPSRSDRAARREKFPIAGRMPSAHLAPGDLTSET